MNQKMNLHLKGCMTYTLRYIYIVFKHKFTNSFLRKKITPSLLIKKIHILRFLPKLIWCDRRNSAWKHGDIIGRIRKYHKGIVVDCYRSINCMICVITKFTVFCLFKSKWWYKTESQIKPHRESEIGEMTQRSFYHDNNLAVGA